MLMITFTFFPYLSSKTSPFASLFVLILFLSNFSGERFTFRNDYIAILLEKAVLK